MYQFRQISQIHDSEYQRHLCVPVSADFPSFVYQFRQISQFVDSAYEFPTRDFSREEVSRVVTFVETTGEIGSLLN